MPIGIGAALIGGALTAGTALAGTAMRNEAQKRENELAYQREQKQIKEQNAYNSPSAQMARMAAAGLNPNLMYEQGEQGLQQDIPHYQPADVSSSVEPLGDSGTGIINNLIGLKDLQNKTAETEARIALDFSTVGKQEQEIELSKATQDIMYQDLGLRRKDYEKKWDEIDSHIQLNEETAHNLVEQIRMREKEWQTMDAEAKARIHNMTEQQRLNWFLAPAQFNEYTASADKMANEALSVYENMRYIGAYYNLAELKFDLEQGRFNWEQIKFDKQIDWETEQNKYDRYMDAAGLAVHSAMGALYMYSAARGGSPAAVLGRGIMPGTRSLHGGAPNGTLSPATGTAYFNRQSNSGSGWRFNGRLKIRSVKK